MAQEISLKRGFAYPYLFVNESLSVLYFVTFTLQTLVADSVFSLRYRYIYIYIIIYMLLPVFQSGALML